MRHKQLIICAFFGFLCMAKAQESKEFSFENTPLELALSELAQDFQVSIYFAPEWVSELTLSGVFSGEKAGEVLLEMLENSS